MASFAATALAGGGTVTTETTSAHIGMDWQDALKQATYDPKRRSFRLEPTKGERFTIFLLRPKRKLSPHATGKRR